ncbi:hypothetical protein FC83_GL002771 [Agrilactobacillus composti DSM 18527 = JCM 14202]|uniref:HTH gntR-type domain-containing protein n=1 Tax=Agrilactobacillus composti DSM 18527 = JCM 14202 TaxID=1423734 RepID=A0A0R1XT64_9LACO|nr:hypothetical protein FC83_GL002771 [Agrilactobacillus composti DSM 18527 = JCM 14202]
MAIVPVNSFDNYPLTWRPTLHSSETPLYIALANQLEQDIAAGTLHPGLKLPPQRELADFLDINVSTVSRAFKICANKGLLSGITGSGTYIAYDVDTHISAKPKHAPNIIDLGTMTPETIAQDDLVALLQQMIAAPHFGSLFQYANSEDRWHKDAAVKLIAKAGYQTDPSHILLSSGGQNALAAIFSGLLKPGDRLGTTALVYPGLKSAAKLFGIQLVALPEENGELSETGIRQAVKNDNMKAIYVMPDAHNPTTHTMSIAARQMIASLAQELNVIIIEDGINSLLAKKPLAAIAQSAPAQTIYIASLSKTLVPALRLAYVVAPSQYYGTLDNVLYNINLSQSAILLELASRLIVSGRLDSLLAKRNQGIVARNRLANRVFKDYDLIGNNDSLNRWLPLPKGVSGKQFEQLALVKGVSVYGSQRFAVGKDAPIGAIRIAICTPDSIAKLERGLNIIHEILIKL